eukprot:480193_1
MGGCTCVGKHDADDINTDTEPMINPDESTVILHHGWMEKKSRHLRKFHDRWTVLTANTLYTFKSEHNICVFLHENGKSYLRMTPNLQRDMTERIDLNQYNHLVDFAWKSRALSRITTEYLKQMILDGDIYFNLHTSNAKDHVFVFQCRTHKDKELWCSYIHQALGNPDYGLILELKSEMQSKLPDISHQEDSITQCNSKHNTMSLVQGFISVEIENDNAPSAVIQMIRDYLFQRIECCFLSKRQPESGLGLLLDRERLTEYATEYSAMRFQNSEWFGSSFDLQRMNSDLNNQRYPFQITTQDNKDKAFEPQLLKSVDCTNHNKFKPFDLEFRGSFPNIHLSEAVKRKIIRSEHMQSREVKKSMTELREKFGDMIDEELLLVLAPKMDRWMKEMLTRKLDDTSYHLMITKRKSEKHDGGYWLHFVDWKSMFSDNEMAVLGRFGPNSYCMQMQMKDYMFDGDQKENDDLHRMYSFTYNPHKRRVWMVSEVLNDIYQYDLDLLEWVPLGLDQQKWKQRRRDGTSLCWLSDHKLMIIGGHNEWSRGMSSIKSAVDLYDLNTKALISLNNMREARHNAASLYLKHSNEIAVGSAESIEFYDPRQDYWMKYGQETNERYWSSCFMWSDVNNPNILYLGEDRALDDDECHIEWVDRRANSKWQFLETPKNVAYFGQFYLNPNTV